jgi:hypothetical protein
VIDRNSEIVALAGTLTQQQIGNRYGITRQRVQQILRANGIHTRYVRTPAEREERFWAKVLKSEGCWEWQGARFPTGYGHLRWYGVGDYAHRVAFILMNGAVPNGMEVCHTCDNPPCVRPDHLWAGTHAKNVADRDRKGRTYRKHNPAA